jgi:hypothetical protein
MKSKFENRLQIHYHFDDDTHSMNAMIRNSAEKELLEVIKRVGKLLEIELNIETCAYQEGSLKEMILYSGVAQKSQISAIEVIITAHLIGDLQKDNIEDEKIANALNDTKIMHHISNYYKIINKYPKVVKIGYSDANSSEKEVEKNQFHHFVIENEKDVIDVESAYIEVISPVLNNKTYRWKGIYLEEIIDFSMGDSSFKKEIMQGMHNFHNGTILECKVKITTTYNDIDSEDKKSYSVKKVYNVLELDKVDKSKTQKADTAPKPKRKKRKTLKVYQPSLF